MPRKPKNVSREDKEATAKLARNLTSVVLGILRSRGMTQMALAEATGYSRSSISQVFSSTMVDRKWTLKMLVAVAHALETAPSQLLSMAEAWSDEQQNRDELELSIQTFGTDPQTPERLQAIIIGVCGSLSTSEDISLYQIGCAKLYNDYIKGNITDLEAHDILTRAAAQRGTTSAGDPLPLWAAAAQNYK